MLWCGNDNESILVHTDDGVIFRSRDKGNNWKRMVSLMATHANNVADDDQSIGRVR
jgi:photosystem II stability/assembly factor-like uncharacterized protein